MFVGWYRFCVGVGLSYDFVNVQKYACIYKLSVNENITVLYLLVAIEWLVH